MKEVERTWICKRTGDIKKGTYDAKVYYDTWYAKNKDKIKEKVVCKTCNAFYAPANFYNHAKTKKHMKSIENDECNKPDIVDNRQEVVEQNSVVVEQKPVLKKKPEVIGKAVQVDTAFIEMQLQYMKAHEGALNAFKTIMSKYK